MKMALSAINGAMAEVSAATQASWNFFWRPRTSSWLAAWPRARSAAPAITAATVTIATRVVDTNLFLGSFITIPPLAELRQADCTQEAKEPKTNFRRCVRQEVPRRPTGGAMRVAGVMRMPGQTLVLIAGLENEGDGFRFFGRDRDGLIQGPKALLPGFYGVRSRRKIFQVECA